MQDPKPIKQKKIKMKKCKVCQALFPIDPNKPFIAYCDYECGVVYAKRLLDNKKRKEAIDETRNAVKEIIALKEKFGIKDKKTPEKKLEAEINLIVRLIDKGQPCIASGLTEAKWNAGHYISVGSNKTTRYHLHNIHIQSFTSNHHFSGDTLRYQKGIIKTYGQWYLDKMNALHSIQPIKLTDDEYEEKISIAKSIVKKLKAADQMYEAERRIQLREQINLIIGIYQPFL